MADRKEDALAKAKQRIDRELATEAQPNQVVSG
jgi:hypothetical protein